LIRDVKSRESHAVASIVLIVVASACGGSTTGPSPTAPHVTSITPNAGSNEGGTSVTISGTNFAAGAGVTIGGAAATNVAVANPTTITATTPAHVAGSADVVVTINGQAASLAAGFIYVINSPPVISAVTVKGSKPREPASFADLDETVKVSATVIDAETPVSQLTFAWSSEVGTFSGSGANVTWTAPHTFATPGTATLRLLVTEKFQGTGPGGQPIDGANAVSTTMSVRLHNSSKEVGDLAVDFLTAFSQQKDPLSVVGNFTTNCRGRADELSDVQHNQVDFTITAWHLGTPDTQVPFSGTCSFPNRIVQGDACSYVPAEWHSLVKAATYHPELKPYIGKTMNVNGTDLVSAVLENDQWKLCASNWDQAAPATFTSLDRSEVIPTTIRFKR
jgi:hypothetical protein